MNLCGNGGSWLYIRDWYHTLVDMSTVRIFAICGSTYLFFNFIFAFFWCAPAALGSQPRRFVASNRTGGQRGARWTVPAVIRHGPIALPPRRRRLLVRCVPAKQRCGAEGPTAATEVSLCTERRSQTPKTRRVGP